MEITGIKVKLTSGLHKNLLGFCSVTFNDKFVVRDIKIIDSGNGPFISMPSRKLTDKCPRCRTKNHLRACYCNECGLKLSDDRAPKQPDGRSVLHVDIAHPVSSDLRTELQNAVIQQYSEEVRRAGENLNGGRPPAENGEEL